MWGGTPTQSGADVSVTPASYTAGIAAGGSVTVGFIGGKGTVPPAGHGLARGGAVPTPGVLTMDRP
jgi:mannan endo-1,4-beta-mannosidase